MPGRQNKEQAQSVWGVGAVIKKKVANPEGGVEGLNIKQQTTIGKI